MKKLVFLFLSLLTAGSLFQACDNSKTYAEMLEDEKNAVSKFIKDNGIHVISEEQFKENGYQTELSRNEYVAFSSNGVYMQIVDKGELLKPEQPAAIDSFANNNNICTRYLEEDIMTRDTTCFNVPLEDYMDANQLYTNPAVFRYVANGSSVYGIFTEQDYYWYNLYQATGVPAGWLLALPYIYNKAHVRLIVPSKMGHTSAQQYVTPFFYDIREFKKAES